MSSTAITRLPIYIGKAIVGSALLTDAALCSPHAGLRIEPKAIHLPPPGKACSTALALWADALRDAGRLRTWRNELLSVAELPPADAVLSDLPAELAQVERGAARVLGILTHAVHLIGLSPSGDVWLQHRALTKGTDPGLWDTLAGGLLSAGDSLYSGMLRETHEEAGLLETDISAIRLHGMVQQRRSVPDGLIFEAVWAYSATVSPNATARNLDGEVMDFACVTRLQLAAMISKGHVTHEAVMALRMAGI